MARLKFPYAHVLLTQLCYVYNIALRYATPHHRPTFLRAFLNFSNRNERYLLKLQF